MRLHANDTIVAPATALPGAWVAMVRLSGPRSSEIARSLSLPDGSHVQILPAPRTFTREEMAEMELPASPPLVSAAVDACVAAGARVAEPGEFTYRAFRNGRIDLAQAESVLSIIRAESRHELDAALAGLSGRFSAIVHRLEENVLDLLAPVEAGIDFVDQDIQIIAPDVLSRRLAELALSLEQLLETVRSREIAAHPPTVLLYGPPNSGKSTLFNRLVPSADALVSEIAGTTRDVIFGETTLPGLDGPVRFADTAGIMENPQALDAGAMKLTHDFLKEADLILLLVDATRPGASDPLATRVAGKPHLVVINKCDLAPAAGLAVSAQTGAGLDALRLAVGDRLRQGRGLSTAGFIVSSRQRTALRAAGDLLRQANQAVPLGLEFVAQDLREAASELACVTGRSVSEELLSRIFSRYCIGK